MCDLTSPRCNKCAKKGLECPGFGIRYRFAVAKTAPSSEPELAATSPAPSSSSKRRRRDLKWVDVSAGRAKRQRSESEHRDGASSVESASAASKCLSQGGTTYRRPVNTNSSDTSQQGSAVIACEEAQVNPAQSHGNSWPSDIPDGPELSSDAAAADADVVEIAPTDGLAISVFPPLPLMMLSLPPLLSNPDPRTRLLFDHCKLAALRLGPQRDNNSSGTLMPNYSLYACISRDADVRR